MTIAKKKKYFSCYIHINIFSKNDYQKQETVSTIWGGLAAIWLSSSTLYFDYLMIKLRDFRDRKNLHNRNKDWIP